MSRPTLRVALACAAIAASSLAFEAAAQGVRPEVGNPLKSAQTLTKSGRHREALAEVAKAESVGNRTPGENVIIQQMKGSIAQASGDRDTASRAYEAAIETGRLQGAQKLQMMLAIANLAYLDKKYDRAAQWAGRYRKEGGTESGARTIILQSAYLQNDCATVSRMIGEGSDRKPSEEDLQLSLGCFERQKDNTGYVAAMEKLVTLYPKKEYWTFLLAKVQKKQGFSDRLALDVFRLRLATGNIVNAADYMEMSQLALQAGFPAEAKLVMDRAYAAKIFGTGPEADRQKRLGDLVAKQLEESRKARDANEKEALAAKDGNDLVKLGVNYVYEGQADKGLKMIEAGIKKGGLKRPEDAKLQLGEAMIQAGQRGKAVQAFRDVKGADGTADLARLWTLYAQRG